MEARAITVLGLETRVLVEDPPNAGRAVSPLLLIHGVGGWAENWRAVMRPLALSGRRVLALDLPGFGESEPPGKVSYFGPENAFYPKFVLAALEELGVERAHIVGHSMGGSIAFMVAVTAPSLLRSLTVVAPGGLGVEVAFFLRICVLPGMGLLARLPRPRSAAASVLRSCFYDTARITPELYAEAARYGNPSFPEFVRAARQGLSLSGVRRSLREAWFTRGSDYRGPALVVWGRQDFVVPATQAMEAPHVLPQAQVRLIERCGHLAMAERPEEFLVALLPFLEQAEEAAAA